MSKLRSIAWLVGAVSIVVWLDGCGKDDSPTNPDPTPTTNTITILGELGSQSFSPNPASVGGLMVGVAQQSCCHAPHRRKRWVVRHRRPRGWRHQRNSAGPLGWAQLSLLDSPDDDVRRDRRVRRRTAPAMHGLLRVG